MPRPHPVTIMRLFSSISNRQFETTLANKSATLTSYLKTIYDDACADFDGANHLKSFVRMD
jgi:hypothetical protein